MQGPIFHCIVIISVGQFVLFDYRKIGVNDRYPEHLQCQRVSLITCGLSKKWVSFPVVQCTWITPRKFVTDFFGKEPLCRDPYTAVAQGAAIAGLEHVSEKSRMAKNIDISDVVSSSLGVEIADGSLSKVIERNTKIPISRTRLYTNAGDFAPEVIIPVYQGDEEMAQDNEFLGHFYISIEPKPADENKIEVTFEIGEEFGILNVRARDNDSGNERSVKFESRSKLSKKEKDKWMKKVAGVGSVHVRVLDSSETTALDMYLNPSLSVSDLKFELIQKGMMNEDEILVCNEKEPEDELRVSDLGLEDGMTIQVRSTDGE